MELECPPSSFFTPPQFYGRKQKRRQDAVARKLGQKAVKLPTTFSHRILGPTNCWKVFYRQTGAFSWARQTAEDVRVFAFENSDGDPAHAAGQRRYLVTSLDVFWHYYSQMEPRQRHHYEIIPEGWPCRLYFDLEFLKDLNPDSDGERMVELLIKYVCQWLEAVFNLGCDRSCVLDLDASTGSKFSRHLIFHISGAVFADNITAGRFIRHIFALLVKYIEVKSSELNILPPVLCEHCCQHHLYQRHQGVSSCMKSQPCRVKYCDFSEVNHECFRVGAQICDEAVSHRCNMLTAGTNGSGTNDISCLAMESKDSGTNDISCLAMELRTNEFNSGAVKSGTNNKSSSILLKIGIGDEFNFVGLENRGSIISLTSQSGIKDRIDVEEKELANHTVTSDRTDLQLVGTNRGSIPDCPSSSGENHVLCTSCMTKSVSIGDDIQSSSNEMMRICGQFSLDDLQSLLVFNNDGNKTTFADLGVYTKNRNFRLYLSSKLNKDNPLVVASRNQFVPETTDKISDEQAMFYASLVSHVRCSTEVQVLTFGTVDQDKSDTGDIPRQGKSGSTHTEDFLEGHNCPSPYPEIDGFIESLTLSHGCSGRVRHWMYFRSSESLLYDIVGCRWCRNVQREHRSNNIKYIVDLRRGICYQKCYDPDCQAVGYRSEAMDVPFSLLPSSFFDADDDDEWAGDMENSLNHDLRDDSGSNKHRLSECDSHNISHNISHNQTEECKWKGQPSISSCDDDDDDQLLLAAVEEVELRLSRLSPIPDLATTPGREDEDFDCEDVTMVTASEEAEMYFHQEMYPHT